MRTKITYLTKHGKFFRTIAPISVAQVDAHMIKWYDMDGIVAYRAKPTTKKKYAKANNVVVKLTQKQSDKFFQSLN